MEKSKLNTKLIPELKKQLKNKFLRENFIIEKVLDNEFDSDRTYVCRFSDKFYYVKILFYTIDIKSSYIYHGDSISIFSPKICRMIKRKYKEYKNEEYMKRIKNLL